MPMSYHEHMGTIIQTEEDVDRFIENTNDKTYLLYDTIFKNAEFTLHNRYLSRKRNSWAVLIFGHTI